MLGGPWATELARMEAEVCVLCSALGSEKSLWLKPSVLHILPGSSCIDGDNFPFYGFIFTPSSRYLLMRDNCDFLRAEQG